MTIENDIWDRIKKGFSVDISKSEFETWISQTTLKKLDSTRATIEVPNKFVARWLEDNYTDQIRSFFEDNLNLFPKLRFVHGKTSSIPKNQDISGKSGLQKNSTSAHCGLNPEFTFSNFIISDCNQLTSSSALEAVQKPGFKYNPLYIYSSNGCGKTHILHAIGNHTITEKPSSRILYLSSYDSKAHLKNLSNSNHNGNVSTDLLLLDNFHLIADHTDSQQECIHIFDAFFESKKQIVVAANCAPTNINNLVSQLKSRLQWGLVTKIQSNNQHIKVTLVERKVKKTGLPLSEDIIFFLANSVQDSAEIDKILQNLKIHSSLYGHKIGMTMVHSVIKNISEHKMSLQSIQKLTADYFNISLNDLLSNKKRRQLSYPRHVAIYLSRNLTGLTMKQIGTAFGKKDHSTVVYALKCIEREEKINPSIQDDINKLKDFLLKRNQLKQECLNPYQNLNNTSF